MRLRAILNAKIHSDPAQDIGLLEAIESYVMNKRTPHDGKLAALRKMDDVMGIEHPANEEFALKVFMATKAEDFVEEYVN